MTSAPDLDSPQAIGRWRQTERARLLAQRLAMTNQQREMRSRAIVTHLNRLMRSLFPEPRGKTVGVYWPIKGEPQLLAWMRQLHGQGVMVALPVVVQPGQALEFSAWHPGAAMARGFWGIPVPAVMQAMQPDLLIAPMLGFDAQGYRLGYGGGYYDRTLAALPKRPQVIGVADQFAQLPTIHPLPHDIPMDHVVTDEGMR